MTISNKKFFIAILVISGIFIGAGLTFGAGSALHMTNSLEFCTSCHEMADNNFEEYKNTIHARNRTGVKAICSDCHVPHEYPDILIRKVRAVSDLYNHALGTVDTKEKFNSHRLEMAKHVWRRMKETDSRECRNCHDASAMQSDMQGKVAQKNHQKLFEGTATCIDCHYGIAHKEPPGGLEPQDVINEDKQAALPKDAAPKDAPKDSKQATP